MGSPIFVIGLTGGIGSGKTAALKKFAGFGAWTIDLDQIARKQSRPDGSAFLKIKRAFGKKVLTQKGEINRPFLADLVFSNQKMRKKLEELTHPLILQEMRRLIEKAVGLVVVDVPLLFEAGLEKEFDATLTIAASESLRISRVARRDELSHAEIRKRISSQVLESERIRRADIVIWNEGSFAQLNGKIREYWRAFRLINQNNRQEIPVWKA